MNPEPDGSHWWLALLSPEVLADYMAFRETLASGDIERAKRKREKVARRRERQKKKLRDSAAPGSLNTFSNRL